MDTMTTTARPVYDPRQYPISGHNPDDDGQKCWAPIPLKSRKRVAEQLVKTLHTGDKRLQALEWLNHRRYTPQQLENFIRAFQRAIALRPKVGGSNAQG